MMRKENEVLWNWQRKQTESACVLSQCQFNMVPSLDPGMRNDSLALISVRLKCTIGPVTVWT